MKWLIFLLPLLAFADDWQQWSDRWMTATITERHEGYANNSMITKPAGTWQLLLAAHTGQGKECLFYKIPTQNDGELKIVSKPSSESCEGSWGDAATMSLVKLKGLQFELKAEMLTLWITERDGRVRTWKTRFLNQRVAHKKELYASSAGGVFYFEPHSEIPQPTKDLVGELNDHYPQHPCKLADGSCDRCRFGVYRINTGELFCGIDRCGEKNQPACLRGERWQRSRGPFGCRADDSNVFCGPDLRVECEGARAICR